MIHKYVVAILVVLALLLTGAIYSATAIDPSAEITPQSPAVAQASTTDNTDVGQQTKADIDPQAKSTNSNNQVRNVYLTFDDGPNSHYTGLILDILKKYGVHASFVVVGNAIEKNPEVLKRIVREGHCLINHTYSHDYKKIYSSPWAFLNDLQLCNQSIASATGSTVTIFRAPGGPSNLNNSYFDVLSKHGYKSIGWNVASADTDPKGVSPEAIYNNVINGVLEIEKMHRAPIILMHDGTEINLGQATLDPAVQNYIRNRESDVAALPGIIEFLQARGYTFAIVDDQTPPAW